MSQTYTDGTIVVWDGPATSDKPAAVLKVVAGHEHHPGTGEAVCAPEGVALAISAQGNQFDKDCLAAPAGVPFTIAFTSHDSEPHNVVIHRHGATSDVLFKGELFTGPKTVTYSVGPLPAGTYHFHCEVHPAMAGTFVVAEQHAGEHATTPPADMQHPPAASPTPTAPQVPPAAAASPAPPAAHAAPAGDGETGTPRPAAAAGQLPRTGTGSDRPLAVWAGLVLALGGFAVMTGAARPARQR